MSLASCGDAGLAKRVIKLLRGNSLLNSEIASLLNLNEDKLLKSAKTFLRKAASYQIDAGETFVNKEGNKDRRYTLVRYEPEKAKASFKPRNHMFFGVNKKSRMGKRPSCLAAAKERSALINSGNYSKEAEDILCEKYRLF